jgi:hypothetical protein
MRSIRTVIVACVLALVVADSAAAENAPGPSIVEYVRKLGVLYDGYMQAVSFAAISDSAARNIENTTASCRR